MRLNTQQSADASNESDKNILADFNESLKKLKSDLFASCRDADAAVNECMKTAQKEMNTLLGKMRTKCKSAKRRQDKGGILTTTLEDMKMEIMRMYKVSTTLLNCTGDSDAVSALKDLESSLNVNVSMATYKRGFKCLTLEYLKFSDRKAFTDSRQQMHDILGFRNGEHHFELMTSELIQRLLKSLPAKVSCRNDLLHI